MIDTQNRLGKIATQLEAEFGRKPTPEELHEATGIPTKKIQKILDSSLHTVSLDSPLNNDYPADGTLGEAVPDPTAIDPSLAVETSNNYAWIEGALEKLNPRERTVITHRYGLKGHTPQTLEEIGAKFKLTRERIRQIQGIALRKLARHHRKTG
jgi:RNA polymerase primary sigma factor